MSAQLDLVTPAASYEDVKAINWSSLKHLHVSPLLYRWRLAHREARKPAYVIGGAIHCRLFEPEKFDARYAVFDGRRAGEAWTKWQAEHPGMQELKPGDMERVQQTAEAVMRHRVAARIVRSCRVEEVTTWQDPETGIMCKGRLDSISPTFVADLKSTSDIVPRAFKRAAADYLYHGQIAWYHDGATLARKIDGNTMPFLISVESDEPYDVAAYELPPETLAAGRALYRTLLRRLVICLEADMWPGVAPDLELLDLPAWAAGQDNTNTEGF